MEPAPRPRRRRYRPLALALAGLASLTPGAASAGPDVDTLVARMRAQHGARATPEAAEKLLSTQNADGSWPDVKYDGTGYMGWEALAHFRRTGDLAEMASAAQGATRARLVEAFHRANAYWLANPRTNKNWWNGEIGLPLQMSAAFVMLKDDLNDAERAWARALAGRKLTQMTGTNRVWNLTINLQLALALDDDATVEQCLDGIFAEVTDARAEGIQPDASFHQHGPQQQFGNYGGAFADSIARWVELTRGTKFAARLSEVQRATFRRYVVEGLGSVVWKGTMDLTSMGRQIRANADAAKARGVNATLERLVGADPDHAPAYRAAVASNQPGATNALVGHRAFYRSDMSVHRTPSFYASVRMHSPRVTPSEQSGQENLLGQFIADGAMAFMRSGEEYRDLFAVWDWRKLPGTTTPQRPGEPKGGNGIERTTSPFVGAIGDGVDGAGVFETVRKRQRGRQSYFFAGDAVACLGAGLSSDEDVELVTTINQCRTRGAAKRHEADGTLAAVDHDGLRYLALGGTKIDLVAEERTGNWGRIERFDTTPKADLTRGVTTLTVSHGVRPTDARYAYAILGGDDATSGSPAESMRRVQVIANEPARQVVAFPAAKKTMATLFEPGVFELPDGTAVEASAPCQLIVDQNAAGPRVTLSDPTQTLGTIDVTVGGTKRTIALPQGRLAGGSVTTAF